MKGAFGAASLTKERDRQRRKFGEGALIAICSIENREIYVNIMIG